jgi:hypothetical protein
LHDKRCKATSRRSGVQCNNRPITGAEVCRMHGGKAPQVQRKAAERVLIAEAREVVRKQRLSDYAAVPVTDPLVALQQVAGEMVQIKDFLKDRVEDLRLEITGYDDKGQEQLRATLAGYMSMLNSVSGTLGAIAKLNIEERMARVTEAQVMIMMRALEATLATLGITGAPAVNARQVFGRQLRAAA